MASSINPLIILLANFILVNAGSSLPSSLDLHVVIISQIDYKFEYLRAEQLKNAILAQLNSTKKINAKDGGNEGNKKLSVSVTLLHKFTKFDEDGKNKGKGGNALEGYWAIWPALQRFTPEQRMAKWTLFCGPYTQLPNVHALIDQIQQNYDFNKPHFVGKTFWDENPTIIHHYHGGFITDEDAPQNGHQNIGQRFLYPDIFSSGFALSSDVLQKIYAHFEEVAFQRQNFFIDPGFEFAQLILKVADAKMEEDRHFCVGQLDGSNEKGKCLVNFQIPVQKGDHQQQQGIFFAIKTHSANHGTRVPFIQRTWEKYAVENSFKIGYFSDLEDGQIPTINLAIPNTERGHCGKTFAILHYFLANISASPLDGHSPAAQEELTNWLMLADDDTLLSVARLGKFVRTLPQGPPIIAGQRYGFGFNLNGADGYDYPTGGAGILFSKSAIELMAKNCDCPAMDSPDDMIIGVCARRLGIPIIHSAGFHQARPIDYPLDHIHKAWAGHHISFHKFEDVDPVGIYVELLGGGEDGAENSEEIRKDEKQGNGHIEF